MYSGVGQFQSLESGNIDAMADASSADLLEELNRVQTRTPRLWLAIPFALFLAYVGGAFNSLFGAPDQSLMPLFAQIVLAIVAAAVIVLSWRSDRVHGVTSLTYELDEAVEKQFAEIRKGIAALSGCQLVKHTSAVAAVYDHKRNAGADSLVKAESVRPYEGAPRRVRCNIAVPVLPAGNRTLYFFPDRLLVYERGRVGALSYHAITASPSATRFIEEGSVPTDAEVVGQTWKFVNKKGGPDRRFNNNRQLPILSYGVLDLSGGGALHNRFMCSRPAAALSAATAIAHASALAPRQ